MTEKKPDLTSIADHCPICDQQNHCGNQQRQQIANSSTAAFDCWCRHETLEPGLLESLPEHLRGKSCICQACALKYSQNPTAGRSSRPLSTAVETYSPPES